MAIDSASRKPLGCLGVGAHAIRIDPQDVQRVGGRPHPAERADHEVASGYPTRPASRPDPVRAPAPSRRASSRPGRARGRRRPGPRRPQPDVCFCCSQVDEPAIVPALPPLVAWATWACGEQADAPRKLVGSRPARDAERASELQRTSRGGHARVCPGWSRNPSRTASRSLACASLGFRERPGCPSRSRTAARARNRRRIAGAASPGRARRPSPPPSGRT